jgi:hypothetical protein
LPGENLQWQPIDQVSARLIYKHKDLSVFYSVTFNDRDEIVEMGTERYMGNSGLEKWLVKCGDYQQRDGMLIPIKAEVLRRLKAGDFSYAQFRVQ